MNSIMLELQQLYNNNKELNESELQIMERELLQQLLDKYYNRYLGCCLSFLMFENSLMSLIYSFKA